MLQQSPTLVPSQLPFLTRKEAAAVNLKGR